MTIASPEQYERMLDAARRGSYALPAINVSSSQTLNAALQGFADAQSDGIIQISVGGAAYLSGQRLRDRVAGSIAFARFARELIERYRGVTVALHTDHCSSEFLDVWLRPLLAFEREQVRRGEDPLFQSHMWDGSSLPLVENLALAKDLLADCREARTVLEIEVGAVAGEEDGCSPAVGERFYSRPADALAVAQTLGLGEQGRYLAAFTFGNAHGSFKPGVVRLRPEILGRVQGAVVEAARRGGLPASSCAAVSAGPVGKPFFLVFHGGSGSSPDEVARAVRHGVVKFNVDTDTQYAFSRGVAGHMFVNYDRVLKVDGGLGLKALYDPRSWGAVAEDAMASRVVEVCQLLGSAGRALR